MGANTFCTVANGDNAEKAFFGAVESACYEHGHGGYTGTIAEKHEYVSLQDLLPADIVPTFAECTTDEMIWRRIHAVEHYIEKYDLHSHERCNDKWGPAGYIEAAPGWFIFFGWASN
jgi:hypothetical protein